MGDFVFDVGDGVEFRRATDDDSLESIASLAGTIWRQHYGSILSRGQINYMLENFQSFNAMKKQIADDGYTYFGIYAPSLQDDKVAPHRHCEKRSDEAISAPLPSLRGASVASNEAISESAPTSSSQSAKSAVPPSSLRGAEGDEAISQSAPTSSSQSVESAVHPSSLRATSEASGVAIHLSNPSESVIVNPTSTESISKNNDPKPLCGYFAYNLKEDSLFLSKLYLHASARGQGIARKAIDFLSQIAKDSNRKKITLTVNKHNANTIAAYTKMGFVTYHTESVPIGNNYFMDDYFMEKIL